jgi:transposase
MQIITLGIDLAKNVFQLHGVDARGRVVFSRRVKRSQLLHAVASLPPCVIGMEQWGLSLNQCVPCRERYRRLSRDQPVANAFR